MEASCSACMSSGGVPKGFCLLELSGSIQRPYSCMYSFTWTFNSSSLSAFCRPGAVLGLGDPSSGEQDRLFSGTSNGTYVVGKNLANKIFQYCNIDIITVSQDLGKSSTFRRFICQILLPFFPCTPSSVGFSAHSEWKAVSVLASSWKAWQMAPAACGNSSPLYTNSGPDVPPPCSPLNYSKIFLCKVLQWFLWAGMLFSQIALWPALSIPLVSTEMSSHLVGEEVPGHVDAPPHPTAYLASVSSLAPSGMHAYMLVCLLCLFICHCLFPCPRRQCQLPVGSDVVLSTAVAAASRALCAWHRGEVHSEDSLKEWIKEMV